jgi:hypothetical protein
MLAVLLTPAPFRTAAAAPASTDINNLGAKAGPNGRQLNSTVLACANVNQEQSYYYELSVYRATDDDTSIQEFMKSPDGHGCIELSNGLTGVILDETSGVEAEGFKYDFVLLKMDWTQADYWFPRNAVGPVDSLKSPYLPYP